MTKSYRHLDEEATPTPDEVECVAAVLEARHGAHAAGIADFLASLHSQKGDASRAWAWAGVAARVRGREHDRLLQG